VGGYLFAAQSRSEGPAAPAVTRAEAQALSAVAATNLQGADASLQAWYAGNATYAGATLPPGSGVILVRADASAYCLETTAGGAVSRPDDVRALVDQARTTFGGLDVMVANAAVSVYADLEETSEETLDLVLDTNLKGALLCAQAAIPALRERGGGSIVLLSS